SGTEVFEAIRPQPEKALVEVDGRLSVLDANVDVIRGGDAHTLLLRPIPRKGEGGPVGISLHPDRDAAARAGSEADGEERAIDRDVAVTGVGADELVLAIRPSLNDNRARLDRTEVYQCKRHLIVGEAFHERRDVGRDAGTALHGI